jgi:hypothetical protein
MRTITTLLLATLLTACGGGEAPPEGRAEGREETRGIRNTEAIGYAGGAIADQVDAALDANDQRREQLDADIDAATQ